MMRALALGILTMSKANASLAPKSKKNKIKIKRTPNLQIRKLPDSQHSHKGKSLHAILVGHSLFALPKSALQHCFDCNDSDGRKAHRV